MAPTINTTKPVATAIATFVSIDKFMIFPFNYGSDPSPPFLDSFFLDRFEFPRADGCRTQVRSKKYEGRKRAEALMFDVRHGESVRRRI
jgi:hypothetical protein